MRRPRSKLEVSTFPFLAVLLCVMGSLLLLLFIMDRRAKIAAQYRVSEELQARKERTKAEVDARQAKWDAAKQALHQTLLAQQAELAAESKGLEQKINETSKNLAMVQARHVGLEQNIKAEADKIGTIQLEIESRRADLTQAAKKETMTKAELIAAARELAELEQAFRQLKALKAGEQQTYSVVPYRGKRGDSRTPIYIECLRNGVIFHPDEKTLMGLRLTPSSLRDEVERRSGPLAIQRAIDNGKQIGDDQKGPYVLFLVRPDGIGSYYLAQTALRGYQLDFGYELVETNWMLDFSGDTRAKVGPSSKPGIPDLRVEPIVAPPLFAGNGPTRSGEGLRHPGNGNAGGGGQRPLLTQLGPPSVGGSGNQPPMGIGPPSAANQTGVGIENGMQSNGPAFAPIGKAPPLFPSIGSVQANGNGNVNPQGGGSPSSSSPGVGAPGQQQGINTPGNGQPLVTGSDGNHSSTGHGSPGDNPNGQQPGSGTPGNSPAGQQPSHGAGGSKGAIGDPQGDVPGPTIRPLPFFGSDSAKKPTPAPPLSRLLGNKDFIITVDCYGDHATVTPGGLTFRWTASSLKATDDALVQSVKSLIARRQASVQPGEPAYRPLIRLCVHADGLNTLYRAYPLLDRIGASMTRENVSE